MSREEVQKRTDSKASDLERRLPFSAMIRGEYNNHVI